MNCIAEFGVSKQCSMAEQLLDDQDVPIKNKYKKGKFVPFSPTVVTYDPKSWRMEMSDNWNCKDEVCPCLCYR